jgi:hypothetical protein
MKVPVLHSLILAYKDLVAVLLKRETTQKDSIRPFCALDSFFFSVLIGQNYSIFEFILIS